MQLKLGVEKLAGWLQLDALILKPVSPAPFTPDPAVNAAGVVCEDQFLRTVRGKDAYQWYFNNRAEGMSTEARQVAFSPGNYAVAYTEPDTGVHALGFAVPVQVTAVPEMWIWVNRIWCIPQQYYLAVAGQKITMWGVSVDMAPVDSWHWDFGDGETAIDQFAVSHVYPQPGIYGVTLTVSQGGCVGRATATICVGSGPPYAGCPCTIQPAYDADADETLETEAILTAYAEGDDYDQTALRGLVADQTVAGQARKQNIHDKPTRVAMTETLLFSLPEELFAQYEADGERITRGELQKALYSAAKIREKDREQTGGAQ
jgi:hypothetical protein